MLRQIRAKQIKMMGENRKKTLPEGGEARSLVEQFT
jgi:hypothetical protein